MLFIAQIKKPLPSTAETGQDISITKVPSDKQKSRTNMENLIVMVNWYTSSKITRQNYL